MTGRKDDAMTTICKPMIVANLDDIALSGGYTLTGLTVQEYDRGNYIDTSIEGKLVTPAGYPARYEGEPLTVMYDIDMRFRNAHHKLTTIDMYWLLPEGVREMVEVALTQAAQEYERVEAARRRGRNMPLSFSGWA